jgi:hypothetical protein
MTAQPAYRPAPAPAYEPTLALEARVECGCDGGMVSERVGWGPTFYAEAPEVRVACPECGGNGYHEVRGVENGPEWAELYPDFAGAGGFLAVLLQAGKAEVMVGWLATVADAATWNTTDWAAGRGDEALLAALGVRP